MRFEPVELTLELVAECLHRYWEIEPAELSYAPVGHGSYHWIGADRNDWGTVQLAPRERDLADILNGATDILPAYQEIAGPHPVRAAALELFDLWWRLAEVRRNVQLFRHRHPESTLTAGTWDRLRKNLET